MEPPSHVHLIKELTWSYLLRCDFFGSSDKCVFHGVRGIDLEGEEFKISISIRLALHGFNLVVGCLQRSGGDGMVVVAQECGPMSGKSLGEFL